MELGIEQRPFQSDPGKSRKRPWKRPVLSPVDPHLDRSTNGNTELALRSYGGEEDEWIAHLQLPEESDRKVLNLDGGCVYPHVQGFGHLVGMNLDSFELFFQKNIEQGKQ